MRCLPIFWLPIALVTLFVTRYAIGVSTKLQLGELITTVIYEDKPNEDVLSEIVKLDGEDLKSIPFIETKVIDINKVHPLKTLFALSSKYSHYSGDDLNLSVIIFGTSITCLTHKRLALHLALMIRLIEQDGGKVYARMRTLVFGNIIPFYMDMLLSVHRNGDDLYSMYKVIYDMNSLLEEGAISDYQPSIGNLKEELKKLNTVIESSCVVNKMKDYCENFKLSELGKCSDFITDEHLISSLVDVKTSLESLKANEKALLNFFKEMDLFRHMDEKVWTKLLKIPQLPTHDTEEFERTEPLPYRAEVEDIINMRNSSTKYDYKTKDENNAEASKLPAGVVKDGGSTDAPLELSKTETPPE
ncbi:uncharacterized protein LOC114125378 [Aphis gossypii]|uniref:uncharacterized protein LOC114125378 n=1 Tax=Aphis gossypii TaxID=80765 RepID=UPI00100E20AF|nr:uncharacterized protein LOC114125378 [Aphis gossypii]